MDAREYWYFRYRLARIVRRAYREGAGRHVRQREKAVAFDERCNSETLISRMQVQKRPK